jgi:hypothetical protein
MAKEKKSDSLVKIGSWAFIIGVVIALIVGIFSGATNSWVLSILILLGLIVGFLNISGKETTAFLLSTVSLVLVTNFGGTVIENIEIVGPALGRILSAIMVFVIPATIIVAIKAIYALAHND